MSDDFELAAAVILILAAWFGYLETTDRIDHVIAAIVVCIGIWNGIRWFWMRRQRREARTDRVPPRG